MRRSLHIVIMLGSLVPWPATAQDPVRAEVVVRIGGDATPFGRVEAVEVDGEGRVYVLDGLEHRLTVFEPDGSEAWSFGREGRGPGEFTFPVGLAWHPSGELWVVDPENQRVTRLSRAGSLLGTLPLPSGFALSPWPGRFDRQGRFWSYLVAEDEGYGYRMAAYDAAMRRVAIADPPSPPEPEAFFEGRTERGSDLRARVPFTPRLVWRLDGEGEFVWSWTGGATFERPAGRVGSMSPATGPRVTAAERAAALDGLSRFREMGGRVDPSRIPDRKPPVGTFVLDGQDRVWAMIAKREGDTGTRFQVLAGDGSTETVDLPADLAAVPAPVVRGEWIVGVERGPYGTDTVVLVRVRAS